jgi:hypothetical protein
MDVPVTGIGIAMLSGGTRCIPCRFGSGTPLSLIAGLFGPSFLCRPFVSSATAQNKHPRNYRDAKQCLHSILLFDGQNGAALDDATETLYYQNGSWNMQKRLVLPISAPRIFNKLHY